ncbi:MAG: hypothetical protein IJ197_10870 [Bacteroidaceae bacterium]|nr:hypothetical protein [Bacteroidaceae bacterium]
MKRLIEITSLSCLLLLAGCKPSGAPRFPMKRILLLTIIAWCTVETNGYSQADYKMAGPYEVVTRDGRFAYTKTGSECDMKKALPQFGIRSSKKA